MSDLAAQAERRHLLVQHCLLLRLLLCGCAHHTGLECLLRQDARIVARANVLVRVCAGGCGPVAIKIQALVPALRGAISRVVALKFKEREHLGITEVRERTFEKYNASTHADRHSRKRNLCGGRVASLAP